MECIGRSQVIIDRPSTELSPRSVNCHSDVNLWDVDLHPSDTRRRRAIRSLSSLSIFRTRTSGGFGVHTNPHLSASTPRPRKTDAPPMSVGGSGRPWYRFRARTSGGVRVEVTLPATLVSIHLLGVVCNTIRRGVDTIIGREGEYHTPKAGVCSRFASASMSVHVKRVSSLRCHACRFQFFISSGMSDRGTANSTFNALVQLDP
ncbi:hypothetical protein B0H13DRAFT_1192136 [Mycena leptocephala]|nr:hypothetical protein B0H13DRAFT_1192136 [Mycena leptocephala]